MSLGENIYRYRTERNWSQGDLADAMNVSRQSISKWENNMVAPDLDKLIKLHQIFDVTLDELILGEAPAIAAELPTPPPTPVAAQQTVPTVIPTGQHSMQHIIGFAMLLCGMLMFLISVFFGSTLSFSEEIGELTSMMIVLVGLFILAPFNTVVVSICGIVYVLYCIICYAILDLTSIANGIFLSFSSILILVWFIVCGLHANRTQQSSESEEQN